MSDPRRNEPTRNWPGLATWLLWVGFSAALLSVAVAHTLEGRWFGIPLGVLATLVLSASVTSLGRDMQLRPRDHKGRVVPLHQLTGAELAATECKCGHTVNDHGQTGLAPCDVVLNPGNDRSCDCRRFRSRIEATNGH